MHLKSEIYKIRSEMPLNTSLVYIQGLHPSEKISAACYFLIRKGVVFHIVIRTWSLYECWASSFTLKCPEN